ncbi:MAG: hypothetical protein GXP49_18550 [Deltaproteobacteria bacterium]|nr:hypothetical protein [Deltaproteobacteria bacterium]
MNDCNEIQDLLSAYHDNELDGEDKARVKQHLASCAECRARLKTYEDMGRALNELFSEKAAKADFNGFSDRVLAAVNRKTGPLVIGSRAFKKSKGASWLSKHYRPILAIAAAILIVIGLLLGPRLFNSSTLSRNDVVVKLVDPPKGYDAVVYPSKGDNVTVIWIEPSGQEGHNDSGREPSL